MELRLTELSGHLHLRIIRRGVPLPLSDVLPVLENLGLRVLTDRPYEIEPQRARSLWIQDFELDPKDDVRIAGSRVNELFHDAFLAIWQNRVENDGFNKLIAPCLLGWREVNVLRAYCRYLLQSGLPFSQQYMEQTLSRQPALAARLWQLFAARFDPDLGGERAAVIAAESKQIEADLDKVASADDDRILRSYLSAINASVRSNYFQRDSHGNPPLQLSFKLRSGDIPHLPLPKPLFEILCTRRVEGVHLHMGRCARSALVGSSRFTRRSAGPDEGTERQEQRHRAGGRWAASYPNRLRPMPHAMKPA
jgi:glutamate dehydrogenase